MHRESTLKRHLRLINEMNLETARTTLIRIYSRKMTLTRGYELDTILTNTTTRPNFKAVTISEDRAVSVRTIERLQKSPLFSYLPEIFEAALDPRSPFQAREILMLAATKKSTKAFFITVDGIPQKYLNDVGFLLSMGGFVRKSHYDATRRMPIQAWKKAKQFEVLTVPQRIEMVEMIIRDALTNTRIKVDEGIMEEVRSNPLAIEQEVQTLEDFI